MKPPDANRGSPEFLASRKCVPMAFTAESPLAPERVLPWQVTMDPLIFASLSHTHYWYEVGMLKVVVVSPILLNEGGGGSLVAPPVPPPPTPRCSFLILIY